MELCKTTARPNPSPHPQGLEGKEISSPSGRGRKIVLDFSSPKTLSSVNLRDLESELGGSFSE
jgi:hypothetical protein